MALSELVFSDLLIPATGQAYLKGCPGEHEGEDQRLIPVPASCAAEIEAFRQDLPTAFLKLAHQMNDTRDLREIPRAIRFEARGVAYRVADLQEAFTGQTWFLRRLPNRILTLKELGLPDYLTGWLLAPEQKKGLVLLCGAQACGKTMTAGGLITERLARYGGHCVGFANPLELPLTGQWGPYGQCFQTEVWSERDLPASIATAHQYASPNIAFINELKSRYGCAEVLRLSLGSNQQMVVTTIHGLSIAAALGRILTWAQELDGQNARENLADSLLAVVRQDLKTERGKRVLHIPEFLFVPFDEKAKSIRAILRSGNLGQLCNPIQELQNRYVNRR